MDGKGDILSVTAPGPAAEAGAVVGSHSCCISAKKMQLEGDSVTCWTCTSTFQEDVMSSYSNKKIGFHVTLCGPAKMQGVGDDKLISVVQGAGCKTSF